VILGVAQCHPFFLHIINNSMSAINRNPSNTNSLVGNKFSINFTRLPNLNYFCQSINLPGMSIGEIPRNNPFIDLYSPGEKLTYDSLNFSFIVDEDLKSWLEIHDWMRAMTFPTDFSEYRNLPNLNKFAKANPTFPQFSDATVNILTSSLNLNYNVRLYDCFPTSLSSIIFNSTDSPENIITADVSFRFSYFDIVKV
jgi:hypothetical protein